MVYLNEKPVLLVCDNTVFVKKLPVLDDLMRDALCGCPYEGAKEYSPNIFRLRTSHSGGSCSSTKAR